jgi:tetratricopeptide (TPR) repeat protein/Fe-S-cluster-containing hydrogenase component 2
MGPWRAAVLIGVHLLIIAHIIQWLTSGMSDGVRNTLSPVEPSESMFTLETGRINAGFVMFTLALASTALFGRFFCGWLCHVVALQDLCGWLMKKIGIHPKPWRVRLLLWAPLALALYLFVWPTFRREVLVKHLTWDDANADGIVQWGEYPAWLGDIVPLHGFTADFIVEDFWATFPPWYISIPFLLICGFGTVYFLGAKAFCSYGCPYGGFFAPLDKLSPVRIRVDDNCNQCGHCTAVCTSNVRVAEEVRDFGTVVDPGCMKCLDCVSVCPNGALRVGVGAPALLTRARVDDRALSVANAARARRWDLTLPEELAIAAVFLLMVLGFRGMYGSIPVLMAMAVAAIGSFLVYKCWRMLRDRNVRAPYWQLKRDGRVRPAGWAFALCTLLYAVVCAHGLIMNWGLWRGDLAYALVNTPRERVMAPDYVPSEQDKALAQRAINAFALMTPPWRSVDPSGARGVALFDLWLPNVRLSWLHAVRGDRASAEADLLRAMNIREPATPMLQDLQAFMRARKAPPAEIKSTLEALLARWDTDAIRRELAGAHFAAGDPARAQELYRQALARNPADIETVRSYANLRLALRDVPGSLETLREGLKHRPASPDLHDDLAATLMIAGAPEQALVAQRTGAQHTPTAQRWYRLAQLHGALGQPADEGAALARARELEIDQLRRALRNGPRVETYERLIELSRQLGRADDARQWQERLDAWRKRLEARRARPAQ